LDKETKRAFKLAAQQQRLNIMPSTTNVLESAADIKKTVPVDCACVIYGDAYAWQYVERLYSMLSRHITAGIRLHVYTEADRPVPAPMIKHALTEWSITEKKRSWWYKMQLFNTEHHAGPLLYFDLDTVITQNIDWICARSLNYFWAVRDFKYLWRPTHNSINSSIMWWNTEKYAYIWEKFKQQDLTQIMKIYHGDQDYITSVTLNDHRFFDTERIKSWRWQCLNGGYDFRKRRYQLPETDTQISALTSVMVFHGHPKPHEITDQKIIAHWR
jgi:hypothetical protein